MTKQIQTTDKIAADFIKKIEKSLDNYAQYDYNKTVFVKSIMLAIVSDKKLSQAIKTDNGKRSIFNAVRFAAIFGLPLDGKKSYLVGYETKNGFIVKYDIMKDGLIELTMNSGVLRSIGTVIIKENDSIQINRNETSDSYNFSPALSDRGDIRGFLAVANLKNKRTVIDYMSREEVEEHRDKYGQGIDKQDSAWRKSFPGMGEKTVIKRLLTKNYFNDDNRIRDVIQADNNSFDFIETCGFSSDDAKESLTNKKEKNDIEKNNEMEREAENESLI